MRTEFWQAGRYDLTIWLTIGAPAPVLSATGRLLVASCLTSLTQSNLVDDKKSYQ